MGDAEYAFISMGSVCGTIRDTIDDLRKEGQKIGMIKVRSYRPFPKEEITKACQKLKGIAVLDKNISLGHEGALYSDLRSVLFGKDIIINGFIAGLGGRDITKDHLQDIIKRLKKQQEPLWIL